jgi:hypothetical protein
MTTLRKKWLAATVIGFGVIIGAVVIAASVMAKRIEPTVREQAIQYLRRRFDSEVELGGLQVHVPSGLPLRLVFRRGRGALVKVEGTDLFLRHHGRRDIPPLLSLKHFSFEFDLGVLLDTPRTINRVTLDGLEIQIPPKGERPSLGSQQTGEDTQAGKAASEPVVINQVLFHDARLVILPRDPAKIPLRFDIHDLRLDSAGQDVAMKYTAVLTNPKPPGEIHSTGVFGPWAAGEPGDTPLSGQYRFDNADLGVFQGIAGILRSTGSFEGTLSSINARGEAVVPDFRLKSSGNPVPLSTRFEVRVDGTNGDTELKPIVATLGSTHFTTTGFVVKRDGDVRKTIFLKVMMPAGNLRDLLTLAMKGSPLMDGTIRLDTTIGIPPLTGKVKEKLLLDGNFEVSNGKFLQSRIQEKIDALSHRAQGKTAKDEVDEAVHRMSGDFKMAGASITFRTLAFAIPGAAVNIGGLFDAASNELDFHGALMLDAKLSETQSGWKRWLLKPVDPFFSKHGAGTFLHIKIVGTSKDPQFGVDPHGTSPAEEAEKVAAEKTKAASRQ